MTYTEHIRMKWYSPRVRMKRTRLDLTQIAGSQIVHWSLQSWQENPVYTTQVLTITLPHCRTVAGRSSSNHTTQCWLSLKLNACLICTGWRISTSFDTQPCGIWIWMGPVQKSSTYVELSKVDCIDKSCTTHLLTQEQATWSCTNSHNVEYWNSAFVPWTVDTSIKELFLRKVQGDTRRSDEHLLRPPQFSAQ